MTMEVKQEPPTGMAAFTTIWIGQIVSLLGTAMSQFGLTLWAYEVTGKATPLALVGFFLIASADSRAGTLRRRAGRPRQSQADDAATYM